MAAEFSSWISVAGGEGRHKSPKGHHILCRKGSDKVRGMKSFYLYFLLSLSLIRDINDGGEVIRK